MKKTRYLIPIFISLLPFVAFAQTNADTSIKVVTLKQCVDFALRNQPVVRQAAIDEAINEKDIKISLAAWLPQLNGSGSYDYYFKGTPVATSGSAAFPATSGNINNISTLGL